MDDEVRLLAFKASSSTVATWFLFVAFDPALATV